MPKLLEQYDRTKDGALEPNEVPKRFVMSFQRGLSQETTVPIPAQVVSMMNPVTSAPQAGPLWFQRMDRNRDGDVSRREFLGTDEDFRKIDTDGDGLIDMKEATAAETLFKKAP